RRCKGRRGKKNIKSEFLLFCVPCGLFFRFPSVPRSVVRFAMQSSTTGFSAVQMIRSKSPLTMQHKRRLVAGVEFFLWQRRKFQIEVVAQYVAKDIHCRG